MDIINVVLVGRNSLFRQGLRRLLDPSKFSVAGEARDLTALKALLEKTSRQTSRWPN
jgi:DNA-binding NarL/FixJ family response regulator